MIFSSPFRQEAGDLGAVLSGTNTQKATQGKSGPGSRTDGWEDLWQCLWIPGFHSLTMT